MDPQLKVKIVIVDWEVNWKIMIQFDLIRNRLFNNIFLVYRIDKQGILMCKPYKFIKTFIMIYDVE